MKQAFLPELVAHGHTWEQWKNYSGEGHSLTVRFADL